MSIPTKLRSELDLRSYLSSLDINPENVFYQRVRSTNISVNNAQWTITSPNRRAYLLSYVVVDWQPRIRKLRDDGVNVEAWGDSLNYISFKPGLAFHNAMQSITLSINGNTVTNSSPRRYQQILDHMFVSKEEANGGKVFEQGFPSDLGGWWDVDDPGNIVGSAQQDDNMLQNEWALANKMLRTIPSGTASQMTNVANAVRVSCQEPLSIGVFNPYARVREGLPNYCWHKWQSVSIPLIDRMDVDINFTKLTPSVLFPRFMQSQINNGELKFVEIDDLQGDMLLWWYETKPNTTIPPSIDLQAYRVTEYQTVLTGGVKADGELFDVNPIVSDLIQLNSTPTLITLSIQRNKDATNYVAKSYSSADDFAGAGVTLGVGLNCWDSYAEINSMNVLLGNHPNVISTSFTPQELYRLTADNCKKPFSLNFEDWQSKRRPVLDTGVPTVAGPWQDYYSKCFVAIQPYQIAESLSSGVFANTTLQFQVNATARDGFGGISSGGNQEWVMYIHLFYGKYFLRLQANKAQYQDQQIPLEVARAITDPPLQPSSAVSMGSGISRLRDNGLRM